MTKHFTEYVLIACGLAAGMIFGVPAAFQFGLSIGNGPNGYIFGCVLVAMVLGSFALGPMGYVAFREGAWGRGLVLSLVWAIAFTLELANAIGFTAMNLSETVGSNVAGIARFKEAQADKDRAVAELHTAGHSPRWEITSGCKTNVVADASKSYCRGVSDVQKRIEKAQKVIDAGRPLVGDAQAEALASVLPVDPATVARFRPFVIPVIMQVVAHGMLFAAKAVGTAPRNTKRKSKRKSKRSAGRSKAPMRKLVRSGRFPNVYYPEQDPPVDFRHEKALPASARRARR